MKVKFWGVRGSIPCPGPDTVKYGGNTACVEIRIPDSNRRIIIDAGSGIRALGNHMAAAVSSSGPIQTEIFLTHTHWDHIMGFPFFTPIYIPGTQLTIYGPITYETDTLENVLSGQWTYRYFPVRHEELASNIQYVDLKETSVDLKYGVTLSTKYLNHPLLCLGYRFEHKGKVVCTAYDTEPFQNVFCTDTADPSYDEAMAIEGDAAAAEENERVEKFYAGADLLIHDTQYTQAEYRPGKIGWGHTSIEYAIDAAQRAGVKKLALFHHDPTRTDAQLDSLSETYCNSNNNGSLEVFFAKEGMAVEL